MPEVDNMTADEIDAEIAALRALARKRQITPSQAYRLDELRAGSRRIASATRRHALTRMW